MTAREESRVLTVWPIGLPSQHSPEATFERMMFMAVPGLGEAALHGSSSAEGETPQVQVEDNPGEFATAALQYTATHLTTGVISFGTETGPKARELHEALDGVKVLAHLLAGETGDNQSEIAVSYVSRDPRPL